MRHALLLFLLTAAPLQGQTASSIKVRPLARIGCDDCAGASAFGSIQDILVIDSTALVLDHVEPHLRTFGLDGNSIQSWSRSGGGPGELQIPLGAKSYANGVLDVVDMRLLRVVRYAADRQPTTTRRLRQFPVVLAGHRAAAAFYLASTDYVTPGFQIERWAADSTGVVVLRLDSVFPRGHNGGRAALFPFAAAPNGDFAVADGASAYQNWTMMRPHGCEC